LRNALVEAAMALLGDGGVEELTVREVARRAGVSHTAAFYHFRARQELLAAVAERGFVDLAAAMDRAARREADARGAVGKLGESYVKFALAHPSLYRLMFAAEARRELAAAGVLFELLVQAMIDGQAAGVVRVDDPVELALTAWSLTHGLASLLLDGRMSHRSLAGRAVPQLVRAVLGGSFAGMRPE
jgi:AcrR family transcriptional regulator